MSCSANGKARSQTGLTEVWARSQGSRLPLLHALGVRGGRGWSLKALLSRDMHTHVWMTEHKMTEMAEYLGQVLHSYHRTFCLVLIPA